MKISLLLTTLALTLSIASCSSSHVAKSNNATTAAIAAAKSSQKAAHKVGFEWRDMGKMIKQAEAAAKAGNDKKAIKIANMVVKHGKQALLQAKLAKNAGPRF